MFDSKEICFSGFRLWRIKLVRHFGLKANGFVRAIANGFLILNNQMPLFSATEIVAGSGIKFGKSASMPSLKITPCSGICEISLSAFSCDLAEHQRAEEVCLETAPNGKKKICFANSLLARIAKSRCDKLPAIIVAPAKGFAIRRLIPSRRFAGRMLFLHP
jgi:hypothetical protein